MNKVCARCEKTVYPIEELKCLDKIWHKTCFKCYECGMTLNMKTYKGFNKLPYCNAHTPVARATTVADTPENRRLAENTKIQSQVKYHADFEQQKGKLTQVADDPETLRIRNTSKIISNVSYHGEYEKKKQMEERRNLLENENGNHAAPTYIPVVEKPGAKSAVSSSSAVSYASNNNVPPQPLMHQQQPVAKNPTSSTVDNYHQRNPTSYTSYGNNNGNNPVEQSTRNDYYRANNVVTTQKLAAAVAPNPNANYISDPRYVSAPMAGHQYQHHQQQQHYHQQRQPQAPAVPQQQQLSHDNRYYSGAMTAQSNANVKAYGATNLGRCFRAIYDYTAQDVDEVSFMDGDLIVHCQPIDDGWMTGTVQRTGQTGMLPSNYVETA